MSVRVSVLIHSYQRPRMLREALLSVAAGRPDQVIVADDGSSFSVVNVVANALYQRCEYAIVANPECDIETRMRVPRQGALINRALTYATGDVITSLCDDDLHDPGWYDAIRAEWARHPGRHMVRGEWRVFEDGQTPGLDDPPCPLDVRELTAGNFAWHASFTREKGARWPERALNCLDNGFLEDLHRHGCGQFNVPCVGRAGWRREHPLANGNFATGTGHHTPAFRAVLERGKLEAEVAR